MTTRDRWRRVYELIDGDPHDDLSSDILDIHRTGSKRAGYTYRVVTFSDMHFRDIVLTEPQRRALIAALGGIVPGDTP